MLTSKASPFTVSSLTVIASAGLGITSTGLWIGAQSALLFLGVAATPVFAAAPAAAYVPGRLLIQKRAGLSDEQFDLALKPHGGKRVGEIGPINVHIVQLPAQANAEAAANALASNKHFKFVEPDRIVGQAATTNDPSLASQWQLAKVNAPAAWDTSTGSNVTIAIIDTGVDGTHPDLAAQMVPGWNFYDNNADASDAHGHGTKVAGTAAAAGNNSLGVSSVAYRSRILPIRVSDASGSAYFSTIAQGLAWAADQGARVANISFDQTYTSASIESAAQYFKGKGGVTVVGAGNSGADTSVATTGNLVIVAATDSNDAKASWSNYGSHISVAAPGVSVYTTTRGGGYGSASGTSFSSPMTAGAVALMMAANPALPPNQVQSLLYATTVDLGAAGKDIYYGAGRIDAAAATRAAATAMAVDAQAPTVSISAPTAGTVSGLVAVDVAASDNVGVARVDLVVNGSAYASDASAPYGFSLDTTKIADGKATVTAYAYDAAGNYTGSQPITFTVANAPKVADTTPPSVAFLSPGNGTKVNTSVSITGSASDNLGASGLNFSLVIDGKLITTVTGGSLSYNWNTKKAAAGSHLLTLTARDAAGNTTSNSITVSK